MARLNNVVLKNILEYTLFDEMNIEQRIFVTWDMFERAIKHLYDELHVLNRPFDSIYALPRGGLCLGVKLSYMTGLPLITNKERITPNTLVVDDCTNTGKTLSAFAGNVTAVMFHKPTAQFRPTLFFQETDKQINFCWESKEERN
ncbi:MAG: hypothetical protein V1725_01465 [archaeon]